MDEGAASYVTEVTKSFLEGVDARGHAIGSRTERPEEPPPAQHRGPIIAQAL